MLEIELKIRKLPVANMKLQTASAPSGAKCGDEETEAKLAALEKEKISHDSKAAAQSKSKPILPDVLVVEIIMH